MVLLVMFVTLIAVAVMATLLLFMTEANSNVLFLSLLLRHYCHAV